MLRLTIVTDYICPPIPTRSHDWTATWGDYDLDDRIGHGATELEAIADLVNSSEQDEMESAR